MPLDPVAAEIVRQESETYTCACGTSFDRTVTVIGRSRVGGHLCPACEAEVEQQEQAAHVAGPTNNPLAKLVAAGVNVRVFGHLKLEEMGDSPAVEAARSFARQVTRAKPYDFVRGLYLAGSTGVGKSQLAVSTLRAVLEQGYTGRIVFDRARALITTIQDRYGSGNVDQVIDARRTAGIWLLDDIGTEKPTPDAFRILEDVLDARQGHPTILTSNLEPEGLATHWAQSDAQGRFASRISPQNYRAITLEGTDRRFAA